jgi:hypothetical protein
MKMKVSNLAHYLFNQIVLRIGVLYGKTIKILNHNGVNLLEYPEKS